MFEIGWPKADVIKELQDALSKETFCKEHHIDINKRTILYAPAWENDGKQDDFVKAMLKLDVNILIKQAAWSDDYPQIIQNIEDMYKLHHGMPRVTILDPKTNIFEAIAVSDVLVSEESSTMCEAAMMGIPAVSVSDWLIPDVTPSRLPKCDYDFVVMTTKDNLTSCIEDIIGNYESYQQQTKLFSERTFSNIGNTSSMIMDIIDDYVNKKPVRYQPLQPQPKVIIPFSYNCRRLKKLLIKQFENNYCVRYKSIRLLWNALLFIKHPFSHQYKNFQS
jgi:CDP-glycerol glycerophosphotransferase (TagB/SpsB family)